MAGSSASIMPAPSASLRGPVSMTVKSYAYLPVVRRSAFHYVSSSRWDKQVPCNLVTASDRDGTSVVESCNGRARTEEVTRVA